MWDTIKESGILAGLVGNGPSQEAMEADMAARAAMNGRVYKSNKPVYSKAVQEDMDKRAASYKAIESLGVGEASLEAPYNPTVSLGVGETSLETPAVLTQVEAKAPVSVSEGTPVETDIIALDVDEELPTDTTGTFPTSYAEKQARAGRSVTKPTGELNTDGSPKTVTEEVDEEWWYRPARGMAQGLRDFGLALLSGKDYGQAAGIGMSKAMGDLDEEVAEKKVIAERTKIGQDLLKGGKATGAQVQRYIREGDYSVFKQEGLSLEERKFQWEMRKDANKGGSELAGAGRDMYSSATNQLGLIDAILPQDINNAAGWTSVGGSWTPGTKASVSKFDQLLASGFMTNIHLMKGMGSLSNSEGSKITAAYTALVDPETNRLRTGLDETFVENELAKLRAGAVKMQQIGQFYEQHGREPTIEEMSSYGAGTSTRGRGRRASRMVKGNLTEVIVYADGSSEVVQ